MSCALHAVWSAHISLPAGAQANRDTLPGAFDYLSLHYRQFIKRDAADPSGASNNLICGNVAVMVLFQGFYSVAWTPLLYLYPPENMNYSIRANGLAFSSFILNAFASVDLFCFFDFALTTSRSVVFVFIVPIDLRSIGWKMYMINASWDVVILGLVVCSMTIGCFGRHADLHRLTIGWRSKAKLLKKLMRCLKASTIPRSQT